jgi:hypothetical protein
MTTTNVRGAIFWGANARSWGSKTLLDNPFPDMPGWYVLHKAWAHGFQNAATVLAEHHGEDVNDPMFDDLRGPGPRGPNGPAANRLRRYGPRP